ncbi:MAG: hypothetical protein ABJL99_14535 [Aliishimia sp.]
MARDPGTGHTNTALSLSQLPLYAHWARDFTDAAGLVGVVFHRYRDERIRIFVDALTHFGIGVSWGDMKALFFLHNDNVVRELGTLMGNSSGSTLVLKIRTA